MFYAVIGNNYGDEGKGLAVDYLTLSGHDLVVRHNGGAQAGHTVDREDKRFVFHELSSGSFNCADTYWADTFFPDLYKLEEEINEFALVSSEHVKIFASPLCNMTLIYDAYLNQKREESRGENKHGSCGMGIWEATKRSNSGYGISLGDINVMSVHESSLMLKAIEDEYMSLKLQKFGISEILNLDVENYAGILKGALEKYVVLAEDEADLFKKYDNVVFEGGQGLMLDTTREELWPHTTCSRTGISNPVAILGRCKMELDEAVYVTRAYLTRHGAGPFDEDPELLFADETNVPNHWQDQIRFGRFGSVLEPIDRAVNDARDNCSYSIKKSIFLTHLNETGDKILTKDKDVNVEDFAKTAFEAGTDALYLSRSKYSKDIVRRFS